jgi:ABC-type uncharacterized transport system substrate-binding protein
MSFRSVILLAALAWPSIGFGAVHPPAPGDRVAIVTTSGVPAYDDVLEGLRQAVARQSTCVLDLREKGAEQVLADVLHLKTIRVIVGIGSEAVETVIAQHPSVPVIGAATTPHLLTREAARRVVSIIPVQVPLPAVLEKVKRVFPARSRLAVIRNPALPESGADVLKAAAETAGFAPKIVDCAGPGQLLDTLQSLKGQVDLVLCFPDASLYNSATIKPLVLASLRHRLPLIGFSESFVRAGATLGVYQDFTEAGVRAADLVVKVLNGQAVPRIESPRKCRVAVNQNITRLLGLSFNQPSGAGEDFVVIR